MRASNNGTHRITAAPYDGPATPARDTGVESARPGDVLGIECASEATLIMLDRARFGAPGAAPVPEQLMIEVQDQLMALVREPARRMRPAVVDAVLRADGRPDRLADALTAIRQTRPGPPARSSSASSEREEAHHPGTPQSPGESAAGVPLLRPEALAAAMAALGDGPAPSEPPAPHRHLIPPGAIDRARRLATGAPQALTPALRSRLRELERTRPGALDDALEALQSLPVVALRRDVLQAALASGGDAARLLSEVVAAVGSRREPHDADDTPGHGHGQA